MSNQHKVTYRADAILKSIPVNSRLKRFLLKRFEKLIEHNGPIYASKRFQELKETVMAYTADTARMDHRQDYISRMGIRNRSVCLAILGYADTQPHTILDLLKVYTSFAEPLVTIDQSSDDLYDRLDSLVYPTPRSLKELWRKMHLGDNGVSYKVFRKIYRKWQNWIYKSLEDTKGFELQWPTPTSYLRPDVPYQDAAAKCREEMYIFMHGCLCEDIDITEQLQDVPYVLAEFQYCTATHNDDIQSWGVGSTHHIPKKGTVKRRPIADPNKWWQALSEPYSSALYNVLRNINTDSTFDQTKFVPEIEDRLNQGLYVGSVDLSSATDYLPLAWFPGNLEHGLLDESHPLYNSELGSLTLARGEYLDDAGGSISWKQGQPLGSKASFAILGITHNFILDVLSTGNNIPHHPYRVLGDDLIIYDERLRDIYIQYMDSNDIPLSLHKSYYGRAVEFAGRWFMTNQPSRYLSDHLPIYYSNLYDYTRSTGIKIQWQHLRPSVRGLWARGFRCESDAKFAYNAVCSFYIGSQQVTSRHLEFIGRLVAELPDDNLAPEYVTTSVWEMVDDHPFQYRGKSSDSCTALDIWKKLKFRPYTTNSLRTACQAALYKERA